MYITEKEMNKKGAQDYIELIIEDGEMPWEGGVNGRFYRISRGVAVAVPKFLAKLIMESARTSLLTDNTVKDYKEGSGKCLSTKRRKNT